MKEEGERWREGRWRRLEGSRRCWGWHCLIVACVNWKCLY